MGSEHLLKCSPCAVTISSSFLHHHLHTHRPQLFFSPLQPKGPKPISQFLLLASESSRVCETAPFRAPKPVQVEHQANEIDGARLAALKEKLEQHGIRCATSKPAEYSHCLCPECEGGDSMERSLSLFIAADCNTAMWRCYRVKCGWRGNIKAVQGGSASFGTGHYIDKAMPNRKITEQSIGLEPLCEELLEYFKERMIAVETLRRNVVMQKSVGEVAIAFTYRRNGVLVSCKYRKINKVFWQEKNTERILYGLDDIKQVSDIIIVEGELDKLSIEEAGFRNCVSVPDGAPSKVSSKDLPPTEEDKKYQYLWNCKEYLDKASRIILATDADQPGQALAEELARRLGRERCWQVKWPKKNEIDVCKDANEVLMCLGPHALRQVIDQAELYPIRGLFNFSDFFDEIDAYYYSSMGYELGVSTGWIGLDDLYKVVPGELTLVTGVPNSGKSEWIDALLCNINENEGWKFALCSMENQVVEHARKLMEKHIKMPFFGAKYAGSVERMSVDDFQRGKQWLNDTFYLIRCEDDCLPSIKWVLDLAKAAVLRHGVRGLVIDPYNELDHQRPSNQTETEYVSQMLTQIKRFAQHHSCHVWFVAHPRQLQKWTGAAPNLYDISGSAHFINKFDNGILIHRNRDPADGPMDQVKIFVRKVQNKVIGNIGDALLSYCRVTDVYKDVEDQINGGG